MQIVVNRSIFKFLPTFLLDNDFYIFMIDYIEANSCAYREPSEKAAQENIKQNLQFEAIVLFIPLFLLFLSKMKIKVRLVQFLAVAGLLLTF